MLTTWCLSSLAVLPLVGSRILLALMPRTSCLVTLLASSELVTMLLLLLLFVPSQCVYWLFSILCNHAILHKCQLNESENALCLAIRVVRDVSYYHPLARYYGKLGIHHLIYSPDEFSVAPVIMKDAECSLVDNLIAEKLILPTFRPDAPVLLRPVYKRTLSIFHLIYCHDISSLNHQKVVMFQEV